jgi:peptide/nickel transport system substrate-binding protein
MENRFGIKDLFLFLLIAALVVVVVMAMVQFDRQYQQVMEIRDKQEEITRDLGRIRQQLAQGVVAVNNGGASVPTTGPTAPGLDAFHLVREAEKKPEFSRGDWFVDNTGIKVGKLTPLISTDIYQSWVEYQVCDSLAWRDPYSLDFLPRLASKWDISPDGLVMRFYLRRDATFSDGEPLTAEDVVWTFNWIQNPAVAAARHRSYLEKLKEVKKVDDFTVEFRFSEFYYLNFAYVAADLTILPKHFYSKFTPDQFNEKTGLLMGSGPYRLANPENWTPGQPIELFRNDRYWGTPPTFDRIIFKEVEEDAAEMVVFGNQEIDHIHAQPEPYQQMLKDPRILAISSHYSYPSVFTGYRYCAWNQVRRKDGQEYKTFFADKRVRQAMTMLLDRQRIVDEIAFGLGNVATGPFAPFSPQSAPDVKPWPFDPEKAKALLKDAGFADRNGDGVIESPDGKPFRFTVMYSGTTVAWQKIALFMKDSMAKAGIVVEFDPSDWSVLLRKMTQGDYDAVCLAWSGTVESDPYQIFHSSQIKDQGDNRTAYANPELDKLIEKARTTLDEGERMKMWNQVHRILHEDQPYTFLFNRNELRFINKRIQNIETSKLGLNFEHLNGGLMPWYVPQAQQRYTAK